MGGSVTARDEETAASEGFVPRTAVVCTRRGAGVDCMFRRFILVFALLCGMILPLGGCSVDTGTSPEDFSKEAREHGLTVEDLGDGCSNAANVIGSDLSDLSDEITFKSCSAAADSSEDGIVMIYVEALDPIDAEKSLNSYSGYLKSKVTNMTNVPNGLEFSYSGDWGAIYAKRYSILFAVAGTANRDRAKAFSQSMGYGVKSIDSHDLIRPACYALAFVIGVISYVWKMFRQKGQAARMARLAWQQQATAPSMPMSTDLSQARSSRNIRRSHNTRRDSSSCLSRRPMNRCRSSRRPSSRSRSRTSRPHCSSTSRPRMPDLSLMLRSCSTTVVHRSAIWYSAG